MSATIQDCLALQEPLETTFLVKQTSVITSLSGRIVGEEENGRGRCVARCGEL